MDSGQWGWIAATLAAALASAIAATPAHSEPEQPAVQAATYEQPAARSAGASEASRVRQLASGFGGDTAATAHLIQLTRTLGASDAAAAFDELAAAHARAGSLNLAAEARRTLVQRYPTEPLAAEALLWLLRLYGSSEIEHANRLGSGGNGALAQQLAAATVLEKQAVETRQASSEPPISGAALYGLQLASQAAQVEPSFDQHPALRFQRSVVARLAGDEKAANKFLAPLARPEADKPWQACAQAELWLDKRSGPAPKSTLECTVAAEPPRLDGEFDEAVWQGDWTAAPAGEGAPSDAAAAAEARLAYDEQFLYIAVRCPKVAGNAYRGDRRPRSRDADLADQDRVRLLLDLDRDYASWFELTLDSRGWTSDRCSENVAWDPEYYVAASERRRPRAGYWSIEAAVPWSELASRAPQPGDAWVCSLQRTAPAPESSSGPGAPVESTSPERFSLVLFK